jgi:murein DD-endopeptidase MepM/ murein hydrolase activator NlpD
MKLTCFFFGFFICLAACSPSANSPSTTPKEQLVLATKLNTIPNNLFQTESALEVTPRAFTPSPQTEITIRSTHYPQIPTQESINYSSPLQGITIKDLPNIISNPFLQPQIGKDDAHHGVDFAFYQYEDLGTIASLPVQSIFSGTIAGITENLPPYGHMLILETDLPDLIFESLQQEPALSENNFSLYVLYSHLAEPPLMEMGKDVQSGDMIGYVGNSGMSGNPHLHLEFRIGPSSYLFEQMGHYSSALTEGDFKNYCIWRVSGWFIPIDPMIFFNSLNSTAN